VTGASVAEAPRRIGRRPGLLLGPALSRGLVMAYLSVVVIIPLAAVAWKSGENGVAGFWDAVSTHRAVTALAFTVVASLLVVAVNVVMGTLLAWVLVRDRFPGKAAVNAIVDLPFALPTIVAGLTLLALYGPKGPFGIDVAFSRVGVILALLFVTLPFVVRAVQPVLHELDSEVEDAAASLGAGRLTIFRTVILPSLRPAIVAGAALAFARAIGEFGSVVLISGNLPNKTEVSSVYLFSQIELDNTPGAAAVSVVLLAISVVVVAGIQFVGRKGEPR
jgi:sulfate transport system permease protein